MSNKIELSAEHLSALDQIIAQKQNGAEAFITDIVNCVGHVTPVVSVLIQVTQAIGAAKLSEPTIKALAEVVNNASVDDLIELRQKSLE